MKISLFGEKLLRYSKLNQENHQQKGEKSKKEGKSEY